MLFRSIDGTDSDYRTNIDTVDGQLTYSSGEDARFVHGVVPGTATIRVASNDNNANTVEAFTDGDMDGNLTGDDGGTGTIDYETGEWSITLNANPGNSNEIYLEYDIVLGNGGGVAVGRIFNEHNYGHAVHLIGTTITGNTAEVDGGGIYNGDGKVILSGSTVSGNTAGNLGGGVSVSQSGVTDDDEGGLMGTLFGQNSTISGNSAGSFGGGVGGYARDAASSIEIVRSTITDNVADADNNGIGQGGGIALPYALPNGMFSVTGTVIAGNADSNPSSAPDLLLPAATPFDLTDSLIGDNRGSDLMEAPVGSPDADNNLIGGPTNGVIDPALGILSDNGGPSFTHRPVDGSPLIDHYAGCAGIDQIGQPRGLDGDGMFGDDCDIGAVEFTSSLFHDGFEDGPIVKRFEARQATIERDDVLDRLPINGRAQIVLRAPGASPEQSLVIVHARRVGDRVELQLNRLERGVWTQGAWRPMTGASARLRW